MRTVVKVILLLPVALLIALMLYGSGEAVTVAASPNGCPVITDADGDGVPDINLMVALTMPAHCWPDHPDYHQPVGGWPPEETVDKNWPTSPGAWTPFG